MTIPQRKPYTGTEKSLVIGIDIGTTLSGVSYALREPGKVSQIQPVMRFSGQREENGNSKVPSVVCYDQDGKIIDAGPDEGLSEIEGVRRAEWFKLRLWPPHLAADKRSQIEKLWSPPEPAEVNEDCAKASDEDKDKNDVPPDIECDGGEGSGPEPLNKKKIPRPVTDDFKTVFQVFTDFLQYLFKSAKEYIIESERKLDPTFTWSAIERNIYFVLTHPNGWEGRQQSQMREAAVAADLVNISTAKTRIIFVTEGEANLHFCLDKMPELHQESGGLLVVDCGGGAISLNTYSQTVNGFKEIVSPDCLVQGSIFVTSRARDYFKGKLQDSKFGTDDDVEAMARAFDKPEGVKGIFNDPKKPSFVNFGCLRQNDREYGISGGKFKVEGAQVAKFFEPAVQDIIAGIKKKLRNSKDHGVSIKYILLVGGFARSKYLSAKLSDCFKTSGIVVRSPDDSNDPGSSHIKVTTGRRKEVADGAVSWYLDRFVSARVAKYSYGVTVEEEFNPENPEHVRREGTVFACANGKFCIPGGFSTMLRRDTGIIEGTEFRQSHCILFTQDECLRCSSIVINLKCYRGQADSPPEWIDLEPNSFHDLCMIQAEIPINVRRSLKLQDSGSRLFYEFNLDLVIPFGSTELKVYIAWQEDGTERRYAFCVHDGIR
ncbi:hypothetical protein JOM56_002884 [Amanita muscaria]